MTKKAKPAIADGLTELQGSPLEQVNKILARLVLLDPAQIEGLLVVVGTNETAASAENLAVITFLAGTRETLVALHDNQTNTLNQLFPTNEERGILH